MRQNTIWYQQSFSVRSQNIWMKARPAQYFLLIPTAICIGLSTIALVPADWAIYSTFILYSLGVTTVYSYASVLLSGV